MIVKTPAVGITTYSATNTLAGVDVDTAMVPQAYIDAVRRSGGRPVLLPPADDMGEASAAVTGVDAVLLPGGTDLDPATYKASRHPRTQPPDTRRDRWEIAVTSHALIQGVPLLGICRGMQILNVTLGGTLHQHIPDKVGHGRHGNDDGTGFGSHPVIVSERRCLLRSILPEYGVFDVPTRHHQAVDFPGNNLWPVAWEKDGTVEAIELQVPGYFAVGVQWHPERGTDPRLFKALVQAAASG